MITIQTGGSRTDYGSNEDDEACRPETPVHSKYGSEERKSDQPLLDEDAQHRYAPRATIARPVKKNRKYKG